MILQRSLPETVVPISRYFGSIHPDGVKWGEVLAGGPGDVLSEIDGGSN